MKTNFACPSCNQTLPATWFTNVNVDVLCCKACGIKLKRQGMARMLGLLAGALAWGIAFWAVPVALGTQLRHVSFPFFLVLLLLLAVVYLPTSWLLMVNFCTWAVVEDPRKSSQ